MIFNTLPQFLAEMDRFQQEMDQLFRSPGNIRGIRKGFPALTLGTTPEAYLLDLQAPGIDPKSLDIQVDRGVLTVNGERPAPSVPEKGTFHYQERFSGRFRRVISLPEDADGAQAQAQYTNGLLRVRVPRRQPAQPQRITVQ